MFCIVLQFTHLHEILTQDPNHTILLFLSYMHTSLLLFCSFYHDLRSYLRTVYTTNQFLFSFFELTFCQAMNGSFSLKERKIKSFPFIIISIHHPPSAICMYLRMNSNLSPYLTSSTVSVLWIYQNYNADTGRWVCAEIGI